MNASTDHDETANFAAMYAAGLLTGDEAEAFEDRLLAGDAVAVAEFDRVRPAGDLLMRAFAEVEPQLILRSNIINALGMAKDPAPFSREQADADPFADDPRAMVLLRAGQVDWKPTGVPGVVARNLYIDHERRRATVLLRLDPGVTFPDHDHPDVEECLILEGDLELGGKVMKKYDYMRIPKGGQHGTPRTTGGCLLLVTCGLVKAA